MIRTTKKYTRISDVKSKAKGGATLLNQFMNLFREVKLYVN